MKRIEIALGSVKAFDVTFRHVVVRIRGTTQLPFLGDIVEGDLRLACASPKVIHSSPVNVPNIAAHSPEWPVRTFLLPLLGRKECK